MNLGSTVSNQTPARGPYDRPMRLAFFLALIAWAMIAGKDVSWDVVNHQLYLPFLWLSGRRHTDLFGAGGQSYQNPLGYFPIYFLIRAGLPAWIIGVLLGSLHALVVWPLDRIARLFWPGPGSDHLLYRVLALAFGCSAPIFLTHDGTTSTDPITALMVLWALALSLEPADSHGRRMGDARAAGCVGVLLGLASAIKLSNAFLAVALCALWLLKWVVGQADFRRMFALGAGLLLSFFAGAGWWMWWLWQDFGNPIFPLYNEIFRSPYASAQAIAALRFVPATPGGMVSRLWEMAQLSSFVTFEAFLPDIRPVLAVVAALAAAMLVAARGGWRRLPTRAFWRDPDLQFAVVMLLVYVLWIRSSGNARYAIAWFVLLGIGLVRATLFVLPRRGARVLLLTALVLQSGYYLAEGQWRFAANPWDSGPYVEFRVSPRLQRQPFLHLAIGSQTHAAFALFVAPDGAMANPVGQLPLPTTGPLGARFESLLAKWHGRTRLLFDAAEPDATPADVLLGHRKMTALVYRIGLDVDWSDCETVEMVSSLRELASPPVVIDGHAQRPRGLVSCAVTYLAGKDPALERQRAVADRVFDILELACPHIFTPRPLASDDDLGIWQRHYANTEALLSVSETDGVFFNHFRMFQPTRFGSVEDILAQRKPIQCPRIEYKTPQ